MGTFLMAIVIGLLVLELGVVGIAYALRRRNLSRWLGPYLLTTPKRGLPRRREKVHLLLCLADHFEPYAHGVSPVRARARVRRWLEEYPRRLGHFQDSDGRPPRHTFFYPAEDYDSEILDMLAELCAADYGEVEIHLHHDRDTPEGFRHKLLEFRERLERHGLLGRRRRTGEAAYGFIHGNWALNNSRPDGRWCGVNNELGILHATGCYADFTMPSSPDSTQIGKINSIYYAVDVPGQPCGHAHGRDIAAGPPPADALLLIQGPLLFDWTNRKWGLIPRVENGCLQASQPPTIERLPQWLRARVQVAGRPDWFFVKLHAHGAGETEADMLLGGPNVVFHEALRCQAAADPNFHFHYVTAREMYNLARAAAAGWRGTVAEARDFELLRPPLVHPYGVNLRDAALSSVEPMRSPVRTMRKERRSP